MSQPKKTFADPATGEEIKSTGLARLFAGLASGLVVELVFGLGLGLVCGLAGGLEVGLSFGLGLGLVCGLVFWLLSGLGEGLVRGFTSMEEARKEALSRRIHDRIARWQHCRRQSLLQGRSWEDEWAGVPKGALSRAQPPGPPEPTDASLSLTSKPDEEASIRLTAGAEAEMDTAP
jgi:hypothetical protein